MSFIWDFIIDIFGNLFGNLFLRGGNSSSPNANDAVDKLERLAALRASGDITEEEFERQKDKILDAGN